jgi:hypothetical protein
LSAPNPSRTRGFSTIAPTSSDTKRPSKLRAVDQPHRDDDHDDGEPARAAEDQHEATLVAAGRPTRNRSRASVDGRTSAC